MSEFTWSHRAGRTGCRPWWHPASLWYLIYLGGLVFQPAYDPAAGVFEWAVVITVVVVYVPIYLVAEHRVGRLQQWSPLISTVLGVIVIPVNSYGCILFVYAAALAGNHLPRRASLRWLVGLTTLLGLVALLSPIPFPYRIYAFGPSLIFVWIIGLACIDGAEKRREEAALRAENARIEHLATLTERERISRDLHDVLGQSLTGIVVRAQLAQRLTGADPAAGVAEMIQVEQAARAALTEVRATVSGWRQVMLDDELSVARAALGAAGVGLAVTRDPGIVLTPSAEHALSLALREGVTNVVRHAHARSCTVVLRCVGGRVVLEVSDDGVGGVTPDGNGLTGMRERIGALGGEVRRHARDGTALTVAVPATVAT